jgi:hypothetical protein
MTPQWPAGYRQGRLCQVSHRRRQSHVACVAETHGSETVGRLPHCLREPSPTSDYQLGNWLVMLSLTGTLQVSRHVVLSVTTPQIPVPTLVSGTQRARRRALAAGSVYCRVLRKCRWRNTLIHATIVIIPGTIATKPVRHIIARVTILSERRLQLGSAFISATVFVISFPRYEPVIAMKEYPIGSARRPPPPGMSSPACTWT